MDNGGGAQGWTITDIPYATYDVYIYYDGGSDGSRGGPYQVWDSDDSDAVLASQSGYDTATFDGTYIQATGDGTDGEGQGLDTNYVKFTGLSAPNIKIRSFADQLGGGDAVKRAPMNGFQIVEVGASGTFEITDISYSPAVLPDTPHSVTLTWRNTGAPNYVVRFSPDLVDWTSDLDDGVAPDRDENTDDPDHITVTFPLTGGLEDDSALYFRVEL